MAIARPVSRQPVSPRPFGPVAVADDDGWVGWRVELEAFAGPLDLLLSLIRREQVDVFDIPVARITDAYLAALDELREQKVEVTGAFLVMASRLMQIKARLLLPRPPKAEDEEDEEDPRRELVELILEYQQYKQAAGTLGERAAERARLFGVNADLPPLPPEVQPVSVAGLLRAYERVLEQVAEREKPPPPVPVPPPRMSVRERVEHIVTRLADGPLTFDALFDDAPCRLMVVATFMALLELLAHRRVQAEQAGLFEPIRIASC